MQFRGADPKALELTRAEVLHQHVRADGELQDGIAILLQVQFD